MLIVLSRYDSKCFICSNFDACHGYQFDVSVTIIQSFSYGKYKIITRVICIEGKRVVHDIKVCTIRIAGLVGCNIPFRKERA